MVVFTLILYLPSSGWPFAALIGLPIAVDILLIKKKWRLFITWCLISAGTILGPQLICDSYYYGRPVFASLNIVWYNVFTSHGPDLYGTEPPQFYLINGLLNFNFVFIMALLVLPIQTGARYLLKSELASSGTGMNNQDKMSICGRIVPQGSSSLTISPRLLSTCGCWCSGPGRTRRSAFCSPFIPSYVWLGQWSLTPARNSSITFLLK